jgi:hypothetical protein
MIVVKLKGGLGNQLFQYAAGKSLATKLNADLYLDLTDLRIPSNGEWTQREFELDVFSITAKIADEELLNPFIAASKRNRIVRLFNSLRTCNVYADNLKGFSNKFFEQKNNTLLNGYWQSEKYFRAIEKELRTDLQLKNPLDEKNLEFLTQLTERSDEVNVSIHVRRGDFITNVGANAYHGSCGTDYYKNAIDVLKSKVDAPIKFVCFSDDMDWVKGNLELGSNVAYVDWNFGKNSFKDMYLMCQCNHHIIANSSFSWWGAWLNPSKEKIVVAPKKWFADDSINYQDIIPTQWIKL